MSAIKREERIGGQRLLLGNCLEIMAELNGVDHVISDPPYEESTHKNIGGITRKDGVKPSEKLNFESIDDIRWDVVKACENISNGWVLLFCTTEGVGRWADYIITNPPWDRKILHPMIEHFCNLKPTWLLFDADWMHTRQSAKYMPWLVKIVSVGRVKWIPDSKMTGKDNCAWYLFDARHDGVAEFVGRV